MTEESVTEQLPEDRAPRLLLALVLVLAIVGGAIDLWLDAPDNWHSVHVVYELALIVAALLTSLALWRGWWRARLSLSETREALDSHRAERDEWRARAQQALDGLSHAMDDRFESWGLTPAEREVALGLLKGRSHKAIAYEAGRSERTVRQHAVAVYQKSGLAGRAELSAFFLEGLMLPRPSGAPSPADMPTA
jgi:DNA-binding CsgD family transcriptional regulator